MLEIVEDQIAELKKLWKNKRLLLHQGLNLAMIVFSALMIWKGLMFLTKSESPVVVVLSGSMEPAFQRGDILFLNNQANPIRVGEVVVFKIKDRNTPCGNQNFGAPRHRRGIAPLTARWRREPDSLVDLHTGDIPIVHRVMKVHEKASGAVELLTKGDNNRVDDRGLYAPGQLWLERDDVLGRAVGTSARIMS
jgi:signal peptidase